MTSPFLDTLRLRAAGAGLAVDDGTATRVLVYFDLLRRWSERINLAGFRLEDPSPEAIDRLLIEPLVVSRRVVGPVRAVLDIGSGGGSPAIPFALGLQNPGVHLTMVESRGRKCTFLREVLRILQLPGTVHQGRFESFASGATHLPPFDVVSMRAVRPDAGLLDQAARLMGPDGQLVWFHGIHQSLPQAVAGLSFHPIVREAFACASVGTRTA